MRSWGELSGRQRSEVKVGKGDEGEGIMGDDVKRMHAKGFLGVCQGEGRSGHSGWFVWL